MNLRKPGVLHAILGALIMIGVFLILLDRPSLSYVMLIASSLVVWAIEARTSSQQVVEKAPLIEPATTPQQPETTYSTPVTPNAQENTSVSKEESLLLEIAALTKLVETKTREAELLATKLKERRDIKILQLVGRFQHDLDFNRELMSAGKMDAISALREIEASLEATLDELGISPFTIEVGTKVRDLPEGSFMLIESTEPPSDELAGTVSRVRQRALVFKDANGQKHFVASAKIDAYKLS